MWCWGSVSGSTEMSGSAEPAGKGVNGPEWVMALASLGNGRSEDQPPLGNFGTIPTISRGKQPRRAELQILWGYFILFYISGGKNWFLVWSDVFQVVTSLPAPSSKGSGGGRKGGECGLRLSLLT
jgi:hypothetical protein